MAKTQAHSQPAPRFTWRSLAGLFEEAWHREQRRRRLSVIALAALIAAGVFTVALTGAGGNRPGGLGANVALSTKPNAGGASGGGLPAATRVIFVSQFADKPIPVGVTRTFKVQLLDHLNKPVQRAGIPVWLSQIIYSATGVHRGWTIINGHRVRAPGVALTNARGIATFAITGTRPSALPTAVEAHLLHMPVLHETARYGASGYLLIRFSAPKH
jgi:hypothetical protein